MRKITIAIDGYSSTGKSSVAKLLAKELGYIYVDSGAMYRAVTLYAMQNDLVTEGIVNEKLLTQALSDIKIELSINPATKQAEMFLNGKNVENEIRSLAVSELVSQVAKITDVRKKLVEIQRQIGTEKAVVMDGRDIGSVVFPDAELKIFLTASPEERARRRFLEYQAKGEDISYEEVLKNVQQRDYLDTHRNDSPLIVAEGAITVDNTEMDLPETLKILLQLAQKKSPQKFNFYKILY